MKKYKSEISINSNNLRIKGYKPIMNHEYSHIYNKFNFLSNIFIHSQVFFNFILLTLNIYLIMNTSLSYVASCLSILFTLILILFNSTIILNLISKKLDKFILNNHLTKISNINSFNEIGLYDYILLARITSKNSIIKLKIKEICEVRNGVITKFDYDQLMITEYIKLYLSQDECIK